MPRKKDVLSEAEIAQKKMKKAQQRLLRMELKRLLASNTFMPITERFLIGFHRYLHKSLKIRSMEGFRSHLESASPSPEEFYDNLNTWSLDYARDNTDETKRTSLINEYIYISTRKDLVIRTIKGLQDKLTAKTEARAGADEGTERAAHDRPASPSAGAGRRSPAPAAAATATPMRLAESKPSLKRDHGENSDNEGGAKRPMKRRRKVPPPASATP